MEPLSWPYGVKNLEKEWMRLEDRLQQAWTTLPMEENSLRALQRQCDVARHRWQTAMRAEDAAAICEAINDPGG